MKLTGRLDNGVAFGLLNASTQRVRGINVQTIEPQTNYLVARAVREMRAGRSAAWLQVADMRRARDANTDPFLRRSATTLLVQGFHRFARDRWEWTAYSALNDVRGSRAAIALTQRNSVHFFSAPTTNRRTIRRAPRWVARSSPRH